MGSYKSQDLEADLGGRGGLEKALARDKDLEEVQRFQGLQDATL